VAEASLKKLSFQPQALPQIEVADAEVPAAALFFAFISGRAPEQLSVRAVRELVSAMQFYMANAAFGLLPMYLEPLFSEGTTICGREVRRRFLKAMITDSLFGLFGTFGFLCRQLGRYALLCVHLRES
jgi:hypothetical protein